MIGSAYGLRIETHFELPGMARAGRNGGRRTRLELVSDAAVDAFWDDDGATETRRTHHPDGSLALLTHRHDELGWLMDAPGFGRHLVAADGSHVRSAPAEIEPARWQLVLVGQALPAAAALAGLEVLHASAVAVGAGAVAFSGPAGSGKSTLAAQLALLGATFMTDDVLAVDARGEEVFAHPGLAVARIRKPELAHGKARLAFEPAGGPAALRALYFLEPAEAGEQARIEPLEHDPRRLLGSAFSVAIRTPERLARQLSVCARLAASVPAFRATVPRDGDAGLAPRLLEHATAAVQAGL